MCFAGDGGGNGRERERERRFVPTDGEFLKTLDRGLGVKNGKLGVGFLVCESVLSSSHFAFGFAITFAWQIPMDFEP
ncbi:hypothetical protein IC582_019025 [Cucumis melo]